MCLYLRQCPVRRHCEIALVAGSENKKSLYLWLNISDAEDRGYWEVGARAPEGGMLSCFNLCQCPSVWRWWEFRAQCVPLYLANDTADQSCRRPSKASNFFFFKCKALSVLCPSPLPYQRGLPRGQIGRAALLYCCSLASRERNCLSFCQCLCGVSRGVARRTCFGFSALPLSFKHVTGAVLLRFDSCPGPRRH